MLVGADCPLTTLCSEYSHVWSRKCHIRSSNFWGTKFLRKESVVAQPLSGILDIFGADVLEDKQMCDGIHVDRGVTLSC